MKHTKLLSVFLPLLLAASLLLRPVAAADIPASIAEDSAAPGTPAPETDTAAPAPASGTLKISEAEQNNPASVRGLSAQQSLSAPSDMDFDGEGLILYELTTGTLVYAKNPDTQREPASLTKVMTCLLALEHGALTDSVTVSETALANMDPDGSIAGLMIGEVYTLEELLYCLMVKSANDAAAVIAEHIAGSQSAFVAMMNDRAAELGCENTHFENPHGLHAEDHYTSARDMAKILLAALSYAEFEILYSTPSYTVPATELQGERTFFTTNYLISDANTANFLDKRVIGGKTGFTTPAGRCVVCVAEDSGLRYLAVVLGARNDTDESGNPLYNNFITATALLDYGFGSFASAEILSAERKFDGISVDYGDTAVIPVPAGAVSALLPSDYDDTQLRDELSLTEDTLTAPISAGSSIGRVDVYYGTLCVSSAELVASNTVSVAREYVSPTPDAGAAGAGNAGKQIFRIVITAAAAIVGLAALILLLLIIRAAIIRSLRRKRRQRGRRR